MMIQINRICANIFVVLRRVMHSVATATAWLRRVDTDLWVCIRVHDNLSLFKVLWHPNLFHEPTANTLNTADLWRHEESKIEGIVADQLCCTIHYGNSGLQTVIRQEEMVQIHLLNNLCEVTVLLVAELS